LNAGVKLAALRNEFGVEVVERALLVAARLEDAGLVTFDGETVGLTSQGRLLSNDVFQEFLSLAGGREAVNHETPV